MITLTEKSFVQPTLSIYLGGTGIRVGDCLLTLRESLEESDRALIEPFFIDSQEPAILDHERARHYCYQDLGQFFQPIYQEFTERRFPENLGVSPVISSCEGCGVTRIFGTASLVACRDDFVDLVEQAVARLRKGRRESTQPIQVFLTASACGGTGAGMILDAAALVRHFFRTRVGENPRIFLFLIGPTAFFEDPSISLRDDQRDRMRASTYALLKELHHFAQGNPFVSAYRLRDETIEIGNAADNDRLFEWVYFVDGRGEQAGATHSLADVTWSIAEAQLHLSVTEVGRKVAESMPNQREERVREYAIDFVHPDNKDRLSDAGRERLKQSSRKTFLASLAVRNVRFPAEEIKTWFRWGWVRDALRKSLHREDSREDKALIDQFDRVLGYDGRSVQPEGLLADLGLTRDQILLRVRDDSDLVQGLPQILSPSLNPDRTIGAAEEILRLADWLVEDLKGDSSLLTREATHEAGPASSSATLLARALPRWNETWSDGLAGDGKIAERLWQLAWDPAFGRGLRWLDALLVHTAQLLTDLAREGMRRPRMAELEEHVSEARQRLRGLEKSRDRERSTLGFRWRSLLALAGLGSAYSEALQKKSKSVVRQLNELRQELLDRRSAHLADALAPRGWQQAGRELKRWRDEVLVPTITAADNALTLAENNWMLARQALAAHQGSNDRGRWQAYTTVQIADDELLSSLAARLADRVWVEDLVLAPLQGQGISRERHRLTIGTFRKLDRETLVDVLFAHVDERTQDILTFLNNGWLLEEVGKQLRTSAAKALDLGAEPLASFSRAALGLQLQSYLLTPPGLILPEPFGRRLGRLNPLVSRDPLQLGVVSFVYGIPPNALEGIRELFEQYVIHLGDQERNRAHDRYPLHVFRDAAETFDEPHSPLTFELGDEFAQSLLAAARELWGSNGHRNGIQLEIRQLDEKNLGQDQNVKVELTEKVLHYLVRSPKEAERLFQTGRFAGLQRLYNSRKYRAAETWGQEKTSNGQGKGGRRPEGGQETANQEGLRPEKEEEEEERPH
jgi:hypothetical protein